jgi:chemotaxis regulatin CheY-phosphate phosphatase CheZ
MLNTENISQLYEKLNELKKVFVYGERLLPIIHKLTEFMRETVPVLENINQSIVESTLKIPKVTNQIDSVSRSTEMATTEILDLVDSLNGDLTDIEKTTLDILSREADKKDFLQSLIPMINREDAAQMINNFLDKNDKTERLGQLLVQVGKMKYDSNSIAISLQVQDITAQQLATVNHLMESVQKSLSSLISDIDNTNADDDQVSNLNLPEGAAYDPNARYSKSKTLQQEADSIFKKDEQRASQKEIDELFS